METGQPPIEHTPELIPPPPPLLPWEDPRFPPLEGLYETSRLLLFHPREAFSRMSLTAPLGKPVLFAIITGWLGLLVNQLYQWAFRASLVSLLPAAFARRQVATSALSSLFVAATAPVWILLGLAATTLIVHLFLLLYGGAKRDLEATFRTMAYCHVATLFQVVPLVGGLLGLMWSLGIAIPGLATVHQTSTSKAAGAVLTPLVFCCACLLVAVLMLGIGIFRSLS